MRSTHIYAECREMGTDPRLAKLLVNINEDNMAMRQNMMKLAEAYTRLVDQFAHVMRTLNNAPLPPGLAAMDLASAAQRRAADMNIAMDNDPQMNGESDVEPTRG